MEGAALEVTDFAVALGARPCSGKKGPPALGAHGFTLLWEHNFFLLWEPTPVAPGANKSSAQGDLVRLWLLGFKAVLNSL